MQPTIMQTMRQRSRSTTRRRINMIWPSPSSCLLASLVLLLLSSALGQEVIRINCGGKAFTDRDGNEWISDANMAKSAVERFQTDGKISNTNKDELYQSELWDRTNQITEFGIPVPNGEYEVTFHFAEIYYTERNARIFDLILQDIVVYRDLDIFNEVGAFTALEITLTTKVKNGVLNVGLKRVKENAKISGIEIRPLTEKPRKKSVKFQPIRINCGGRAMTDRAGNKWEKDIYHNGRAEEYDYGPTDFRGTTDDILYQTERFDKKLLKYEIPNIPTGAYKILLHFSENWFTSKNQYARGNFEGARVFDIAIQGIVQQRMDIYKEAGEYTAVVREFPAFVEDGFLSIELKSVHTFPKVSGIQVFAIQDVAPFREVYRWDNYDAQKLSLIIMNAMDSSWTNLFAETVKMWDEGDPDSLTLFPVKADHDAECEAVPNQIVVCNGDYGDVKWTGLNTITLAGGYIRNSVVQMNDYYLKGASVELRRYALCHELGHAFGLPHTDEEYYNAERGDCLDYTVNPKKNMQPGKYNFNLLKQLYGDSNRRILRYLKKKKKKKKKRTETVTQGLFLLPGFIESAENDQGDVMDLSPKEVQLYQDFVTVVELESCDKWNEGAPKDQQATLVHSNEYGEVCELEFGEDMLVQVRKLYWFEGWDVHSNKRD